MAGYPARALCAIEGRVTPVFTTKTQRHRETIYNRGIMGSFALGAGVALTAVALGYQTKSPTGQWYGRTFTGLKTGTRQLALTYDDGPNDPHTPRLLEVLARHNVRATFFLIGRYVKQRTDIARELAQAGHVVGNHTFSHPNLIFCSTLQTRMQLQDCEKALTDAVGEHSTLFRPPFGGRRPGTLRIARALGLEPVMWSVPGWDWRGKPADYVERKVNGQIRGGDVILLHDGCHEVFGADRSQTVIATDRLIARYKSEGYEFVTVPEMLKKPVVSSQLGVPS
jgi:peptidoglycan/xylan/chitin deacetylase (PgdA/CDA1 family)